MMRKVYLEGEIGDRFGHEFEMEVNSVKDVISCLEVNFPDFKTYLFGCHDRGVGFICSVAGEGLQHEEELLLEYQKGDITISAAPVGSKDGLGKIFLAVVLAVVSYGLYSAAGLAAFAGETALAAGLAKAGLIAASLAVNFALTGIQQLMAPDPSVDVQQDESYLFQGSAQTILEGDPVPVLYGKLRVPGRPISFEIKNAQRQFTDYANPGQNYIENNDPGGSPSSPGAPDNGKNTSQQGGYTQES